LAWASGRTAYRQLPPPCWTSVSRPEVSRAGRHPPPRLARPVSQERLPYVLVWRDIATPAPMCRAPRSGGRECKETNVSGTWTESGRTQAGRRWPWLPAEANPRRPIRGLGTGGGRAAGDKKGPRLRPGPTGRATRRFTARAGAGGSACPRAWEAVGPFWRPCASPAGDERRQGEQHRALARYRRGP
jgi:hypothetical protein